MADSTLFTSAKDWIQQKADDVLHTAAVAGEGALHAAADTAGFVGDVGVDAVKLAKNAGKKIVRSSEPPETLDIPGFGPVSAMTQQSYEKAQQQYTGGNVPKPRNKFEEGVNIASRGAADVLAGGPEIGGPRALASGAAAALAGSAVNDLTDSPGASAAAALITGLVTHAAPDAIGHVRTTNLINAGLNHPDYVPLVNEVVNLEGGGSFDHPKTNPKSGAMGKMQVTPDTARDPGYGIRPWDGKSQADLARVGRQKFAVLLGKYDDPEKALAAYNWGEGNVDKAVKAHGDDWYYHAPKETQDYVAKGMMRVYNGPRSVSSNGHGVPPIDMHEAMGMDPNIVNDGDYEPLRDNGQDMSREGPIVPEQPSWDDINNEFPGWNEDHDSGPSLMDSYDDPNSPHYIPDNTRSVEVDNGKDTYHDSDLDNSLLQLDDPHEFVQGVTNAMEKNPRWYPGDDVLKKFNKVSNTADVIKTLGEGNGYESIEEPNLRDPAIQNSLDKIAEPSAVLDAKSLGKRPIDFNTDNAVAEPDRSSNQKKFTKGPVFEEPKQPYPYEPNMNDYTDAEWERLSLDKKMKASSADFTNRQRRLMETRDTNPPAASSSFGTARPNMRNRAAPTKAPEGHPEEPSPYDGLTPEEKLTKAINEAKPLSREQRNAQHEERIARAAKIAGIMQGESGLKGYKTAMKELKGQLPKSDYESIAHHFTEDDVNQLLNRVAGNNWLLPYEKVTAQTALMKLLGAEGGKVPTPAELKLLAHIFPDDMIDALMKNRPFAEKFWNAVANGLNVPRSLMASFDLSAPLRQGVFMVGRKEFYPAFIKMFQLFGSEKASRAMMDDIKNRDTYQLMKRAGLAITDPEGRFMDAREEQFMSQWAEHMPGENVPGVGVAVKGYNKTVGKVVRASDRAYSGFLNKLRADTFDSLVKLSREAGVDLEHDGKALRDIAHYINSATGRGDVGGLVAKNAHLLNGMFFSPRLMASRVTMLNPAFYVRLSPVVRREAIKSLLSFTAIATTVLSLAKMNGASVELDPRSADFAKIRVGNTRFDILGGFQQYIRFGAQLISGETKTAKGQMKSLTSGKFGQDTRLDVVEKFFENKFSPVASFIGDYLRGKDTVGKKFNLKDETIQRFIPLVAQDTADALKEYGAKGLIAGVPGIFGVGVQTYKPQPSKPKHHSSSIFVDPSAKPRKPRKGQSVFVSR